MSQNFRKFTKSAGFFLQVHILTKCCYSIALIDRINPSITPTQQPNFPYQNLAKKNLRNCDSRISFNELVSWVFSSDGPSEETQRIFRWRRRRLLLPHGWRYGQRALGVEMDLCWFRGFRSRKRTNSRFQDSKSNRMEVWLVENRTEFIRQNMGHSHHFYLAKLFQNIQLIFFRNLESNWSSNLYLKGGFVQQRSDPTRFWSAPFLGTEFVPFCWAGAKLSFDGSWSPFFRRLLGCTEFGCLDNFFEKKNKLKTTLWKLFHTFSFAALQSRRWKKETVCNEKLWNGLAFAVDKHVTMYIILFVIQSICLTIFHYEFIVCRSCEFVQYAVTSMDFVPLLSFFQEFIIGIAPSSCEKVTHRINIPTSSGKSCGPTRLAPLRTNHFTNLTKTKWFFQRCFFVDRLILYPDTLTTIFQMGGETHPPN